MLCCCRACSRRPSSSVRQHGELQMHVATHWHAGRGQHLSLPLQRAFTPMALHAYTCMSVLLVLNHVATAEVRPHMHLMAGVRSDIIHLQSCLLLRYLCLCAALTVHALDVSFRWQPSVAGSSQLLLSGVCLHFHTIMVYLLALVRCRTVPCRRLLTGRSAWQCRCTCR
jgi:hypothetical protein